jgi:AraC-like DNA-binding protein
MSDELFDKLLIFICFVTALHFSGTISLLTDKNFRVRSLLASFLFMMALYCFSMFVTILPKSLLGIYSIYICGIVILSPFALFFLYVQELTGKKNSIGQIALHFVPALIFNTIISLIYASFSIEQKTIICYASDWNDYLSDPILGIFCKTTFAMDLYFKFQAIVYVILTVIIVQRHKKIILNDFSSIEKISLKWVSWACAGFLILGLCVVTVSVQQFLPLTQRIVFFSILLIILIVIGLGGLLQKDIYTLDNVPVTILRETPEIGGENTLQTEVKEDIKQRLREKLIKYFETEKPYIRPDLSLEDVCIYLQTNRSYISRIINDDFELNFYHFVNRYRIEEAKRLFALPEKDHFSIKGIAEYSGFKSISTFNTAFKKFEGTTPSSYKNMK